MLLVSSKGNHVSLDAIEEFESSIKDRLNVQVSYSNYSDLDKLAYFFYRVLKKLNVDVIPYSSYSYRVKPLGDSGHLFVVMMGLDEMKFRPLGMYSHHVKSVYLFDAWPKDYDEIVGFCEKYKIDYLFVTSVQSADRLGKKLSFTKVYYVPEAINFTCGYYSLPYENKDIDVLALGRKWDEYHNKIVDGLSDNNINYAYEVVKGEIVFPNRNSFLNGLARSKISICVPSSITHPNRSGDIETMTIRYLQSMASRCLVLGVAPKEMVDLFGYNPVIEIDMDKPVEQILQILENYSNYKQLIDKNYNVVIRNHCWTNRIDEMIGIWNNTQK